MPGECGVEAYLRHAHRALAEIAALLGYSEPSPFSPAFRRRRS
jgi:AraC-like DNA-binding protein